MTHLKSCLSQNIERAVNIIIEGCGGWVREVSVRRDFEANMVFDRTSFHGFSYIEIQSLFQTEVSEEDDEESNLDEQEEN